MVLSLVLQLLVVAGLSRVPEARADAAGAGGDYVALATPFRAIDTRSGIGAPTAPVGPGVTASWAVTGRGGVPSTGVTAVLVDVSVISNAATWVVLWEEGTPQPPTSNINVPAGTGIISNTAIVPASAAGKISAFNSSGSTNIVIDIQGYYTAAPGTGSGQGGYVGLPHTPLVNTGTGLGAPKATIPNGGSLTVTVAGGNVPATAQAAYLDIQVPSAANAGWLAAYPAGGTAGQSVLDYVAGTTSSGLSVKLGTGGKVTIVNHNYGGKAINIVLALQGYFTADPTQGAGYRKATARLLNGEILPANGTIDIPVAGRFGVATRGVAGAAINFTVTSQNAAGSLHAWPVGTPEPATSLTTFAAGGPQRADLGIVQLGAEGTIRVHNVSSGQARLFIDLQGWFADRVPVAPITTHNRMVVFQPAPVNQAAAPLEYAYVRDNGGLMVGHQPYPENFQNIQWIPVQGSEAFTGEPAMGQVTDGKLQIAALNIDSNEWSRPTNGTPNEQAPVWGSWTNTHGVMNSGPALARQADGSLVQFAVDVDGRLWRLAGTGADQTWRSLGDADLVGTPVVVALRDGFQIFAGGTTGTLKTALYRADGLSAWTDIGGIGLTGAPAVVVNPGYRLRVFVRGTEGAVLTKAQDADGVFDASWSPVGTFGSAGSPAAVINPITGRIQVFARGTDNELYFAQESGQATGSWGDWMLVRDHSNNPSGTPDGAITDPAVQLVTSANGTGMIVVFRNVNDAVKLYEIPPAGAAAQVARAAEHASGDFVAHTVPAR